MAEGISLDRLIEAGAGILSGAGVAEPRRRARQIAETVLALSSADLLGNMTRTIAEQDADRCRTAFRRHAGGEPVSRIAGRREFWGEDYALCRATLDPRPDSETVIEAVLDLFPDRSAALTLIDLGTGSGALMLALLSEYASARAVATDASHQALKTARANAIALGRADRVAFIHANWLSGIGGPFDLIMSNPPYIRSGDLAALDPCVRDHDPHLALNGGPDGLDCYRAILKGAGDSLRVGGWLVFEIGVDMAASLDAMVVGTRRFGPMKTWRDLAGRIRVVGFPRL